MQKETPWVYNAKDRYGGGKEEDTEPVEHTDTVQDREETGVQEEEVMKLRRLRRTC
jgi:hypothetical protein